MSSFSMFELIPLPLLVCDRLGNILDTNHYANDFLNKVFSHDHAALNVRDILKEKFDDLWSQILSGKASLEPLYIFENSQFQRFVRIHSQLLDTLPDDDIREEKVILTVVDLDDCKSQLIFFEQSYMQFMESTQNLEKALTTIQEQKKDIERINQKMLKTQQIMQKDMEIAVILQNELLPELESQEGWDVGYFFHPMTGVSGDAYDFYNFNGMHYFGITLMDASGHGISSSLITTLAKPIFQRNMKRFKKRNLVKAMTSANEELIRQIGKLSNYLSAVSLRFYKDKVEYVNAGHPYILYFNKKKEKVYELDNDGLLLGVAGFETDMVLRFVNVQKGDVLFIYTDGIMEARNERGESFGTEQINRIISQKHKSAETMKNEIIEAAAVFGVDFHNTQDDITFFVFLKK